MKQEQKILIGGKSYPRKYYGAYLYFQRFDVLHKHHVFDGVNRVVIPWAGTPSEIGGLIFLKREHKLDFSIDGFDIQMAKPSTLNAWLHNHFPGEPVRITWGIALGMHQLRGHDSKPWDMVLDQESGPLHHTLGIEIPDEGVLDLLKEYANNLSPGGKLVTSKDFNYPGGQFDERLQRAQEFLASGDSPFKPGVEITLGTGSTLVVYEKK